MRSGKKSDVSPSISNVIVVFPVPAVVNVGVLLLVPVRSSPSRACLRASQGAAFQWLEPQPLPRDFCEYALQPPRCYPNPLLLNDVESTPSIYACFAYAILCI